MRALLLPIGRDRYAVPLAAAREILTAPAVTPLPTAPPAVLGMFNLRGEVVPLLDTGLLLGGEPVGNATVVVVVETGHGAAGLAGTANVSTVELTDVVGTARTEHGRTRYRVGDDVVTELDVSGLVAGLRKDAA